MAYTISEFAAKLNLSTPTVRYYEDEGLLKPQRAANNRRFYTDEDVAWMRSVLHLKQSGMQLEDIRRFIALRAQGNSTLDAQRQIVDERLAKLQHQIATLSAQRDQLIAKRHDFDPVDGGAPIIATEPFTAYLKRLHDKQ
ncbi:MerR family transcriptional regulator [Lacticaseibacillus sp. GG6-2]